MNKTFKTLLTITFASFACLFTACGESTTNAHSDDDEEIADDEFDEDNEPSSSSEKAESSSSRKEDSSSATKSTEPAKHSRKVSGVSQKGPFLVGSQVTFYEVEGESFDPSGRSFGSQTKNDKGEFEVSFKNLSSNYALFIVDGFYRNEVTGEKSISRIMLNALSDLTDRKTVNVNILTHLEYNRVKYLVGTKGVEYGKAKVQAEKEILDAFGISFKEGASAEDLNIVGATENDGALLALSVLMQGISAEGDFSERLALVAQDLEKNGFIDDKQILADIADGVALLDLDKVRNNIKGWKLSTTVPEFENYVENFWTANYGIGACTKEDVTKSAANTNKLSKNHKKKYVCEENGWRLMTDDEAKYGTCTATEDGKRFEKSRICDGGKWRSLTADESMGACTEEKIGETAVEGNELSKNFKKKHICDKSGWRLMTDDEAKYGTCTATEDGKRFEKSRICDGGKWRSLTADESMGACTEEKIGEMAVEKNELSSNYGKTHVCDVEGWRLIYVLEDELGACTENKINSLTAIYEGEPYACTELKWYPEIPLYHGWSHIEEFVYDSLTFACNHDGDVIHSEVSGYYYVCRNGKLSTLTFDDMSLDKDFTADVWNGATDSKFKVGEKEFEILNWAATSMSYITTNIGTTFNGSIYGENGDMFSIDSDDRIAYPVYDKEGVSSALKDKGIMYRYEFKNLGSGVPMVTTSFTVGNADISDWKGLCIVYTSSMPLYIGFRRKEKVTIPATKELSVANLKWDDFTVFDGQGDITEIVKKADVIDIDAAKDKGHDIFTSGAVYIAGIGKYNGCSVK